MYILLRKRYLWLVLLLILAGWGEKPVEAEDASMTLPDAIQLYDEMEWEQAIIALNQLLETGELSRGQRTRARQTLALAHMSLRQDQEAVDAYKEIVRDDPSFNLRSLGEDPDAALLKHLGQALLEVRDEDRKALEEQRSRTSRRTALMRSTVLPGWGQRYRGYRNRGYAMLSLTAASIVYAVVAENSYQDARDTYDNAPVGTTPSEFNELHNKYTEKSDRADLALGIIGAVWLLNVFDAASVEPNIKSTGLALTPAGQDGLQLVYSKSF